MQVQVFCFSRPYFSWSWKIDPEEVRAALGAWMSRNRDVAIRDIRHDSVASFWYPPQLFVTIYYDDATGVKQAV